MAYNFVNSKVGDPKDAPASMEEETDFLSFDKIKLEEVEVDLNEGNYHTRK